VVEPVIRRTESHFAGGGGRTLFRRSWDPGDARRLLVVVHGFAEHSGRYEHLGAWFARRGSAVHAFDLQGHGQSDGPRGYVERFDDFLDDLGSFLGQAKAEHPGVPAYVVGHSMGGLVSAAFAQRRRPMIQGLVLSGPLLHAADPITGAKRAVARLASRLLPRLAIARPISGDLLATDPKVGFLYDADPLVFSTITLALGRELLDAADEAVAAGGDIDVPTLLLHGGDDRLCLPSGSEALHPQIGVAGSELEIYPGLRHEIFNEPEHERIFERVLDWLEQRERGAA
jgi:alpha-beta hydrolase superfamily lysophospholipase